MNTHASSSLTSSQSLRGQILKIQGEILDISITQQEFLNNRLRTCIWIQKIYIRNGKVILHWLNPEISIENTAYKVRNWKIINFAIILQQ